MLEVKKNGGWLGMIGGTFKPIVERNVMFCDNPTDFGFNTTGMHTADVENKIK